MSDCVMEDGRGRARQNGLARCALATGRMLLAGVVYACIGAVATAQDASAVPEFHATVLDMTAASQRVSVHLNQSAIIQTTIEVSRADVIASQVAGFAGAPSLLLVLGVTAGVVFLTELTSNTATAATLIPILAALAPGLGVEPMLLIVPAALAASCAFMLPVATPPNAVIFGSGEVSIPEMARAGLWLNVVGIVLITALAYLVMLPLLAAR